jgi:hypothetical protein
MSKKSYINRPKEAEPTYSFQWSDDEVERHMDTLDLPGLQKLHREMYGPYVPPVFTKREARHAISSWCAIRQLEREGLIEPATDEQGNQIYRRGQRVSRISSLGENVLSGQRDLN